MRYRFILTLYIRYPTEINGLAMRQKGAAMGTATNWIFNLCVTLKNSVDTAPMLTAR